MASPPPPTTPVTRSTLWIANCESGCQWWYSNTSAATCLCMQQTSISSQSIWLVLLRRASVTQHQLSTVQSSHQSTLRNQFSKNLFSVGTKSINWIFSLLMDQFVTSIICDRIDADTDSVRHSTVLTWVTTVCHLHYNPSCNSNLRHRITVFVEWITENNKQVHCLH